VTRTPALSEASHLSPPARRQALRDLCEGRDSSRRIRRPLNWSKLMENSYRDTNSPCQTSSRAFRTIRRWTSGRPVSLANHQSPCPHPHPGPGVGGHCISVDPWFLVEAAPELTPLIASARALTISQPKYWSILIGRRSGRFRARGIAGASAWPTSPMSTTCEESPAAEVVRLLKQAGAQVRAWSLISRMPIFPRDDASSFDAAVADADVIALAGSACGICRLEGTRASFRHPRASHRRRRKWPGTPLSGGRRASA